MVRPFTSEPSATAAFEALKGEPPLVEPGAHVRAVVIGGGTGAPVSIRALLSMGFETSAVVAMADDGGSTGILRSEANMTPPGDIRKCLVAFARDCDEPLTKAFKYRFEFARNHTLGNLMLSALEEATGSFPEAIRICEGLLEAQGHVYPSTLDCVTLVARTKDGQVLTGQANASASDMALQEVRLAEVERCRPYAQAMRAIREADLIVLGPGSLFTSIIPNILVPGIAEAIAESDAKTLFVCSLADMQGETRGMSAREHVEALLDHGLRGNLDYVLVHAAKPPDAAAMPQGGRGGGAKTPDAVGAHAGEGGIKPVAVSSADITAIESEGPVVIACDLVDAARPTWHDPHALRNALKGVLRLCHLPQM